MTDSLQQDQRIQDIRKSKVRVCVTYGMTGAYIVGALGLITWLMWQEETELAIGIFSGVASTTTAIIAFWFGSRGATRAGGPAGGGNEGTGER